MGTLNFAGGASLSGSGSNLQSTSGLDFDGSWVDAPPGTIIQTVYSQSNMSSRIQTNSTTPTEIHSQIRTSITLKKSTSKVLITYTVGWRQDGASGYAYILPQVSTDGGSNFSIFTDYTGANANEMLRNSPNDTYTFDTNSLSFVDWNTTATTRMYSIFVRVGSGTIFIGDNQPRTNLILHEIAQ